jgi:hypothetical protein
MRIDPLPQTVAVATMQTVLDRLTADPALLPRYKRELCSAVTCYARLVGQPPAAIPLDLAAIRQTLDTVVPASAKISRKRWATIRSVLADGINVSGVRPMLKTAGVELNAAWRQLMDEAPPWMRHGCHVSPAGAASAELRQKPSMTALLSASSRAAFQHSRPQSPLPLQARSPRLERSCRTAPQETPCGHRQDQHARPKANSVGAIPSAASARC